jgi:hypothetical protein
MNRTNLRGIADTAHLTRARTCCRCLGFIFLLVRAMSEVERPVPPPIPPRSSSSASDSQADGRSSSDEEDNGEVASLIGSDSPKSDSPADKSKASQYSGIGERKKLPFYAPFLYRDYVILYCINIAEFFSSTLSTLTLLQWLYEDTGSGMALGGLGIVTMCVNVPGITIGGVLADEMDRKLLLSRMQMVQLVVLLTVWLLEMSGLLAPWHVYVAIALLTGARQLEGSARGVLTAACVPRDVLPYAISVNTITSNLGEIVAPFVFYVLTLNQSLTPAFVSKAAEQPARRLCLSTQRSQQLRHILLMCCSLATLIVIIHSGCTYHHPDDGLTTRTATALRCAVVRLSLLFSLCMLMLCSAGCRRGRHHPSGDLPPYDRSGWPA